MEPQYAPMYPLVDPSYLARQVEMFEPQIDTIKAYQTQLMRIVGDALTYWNFTGDAGGCIYKVMEQLIGLMRSR